MEKIMLYRDKNGNVRCTFRGLDMSIDELNIPLLAQLYRQSGQMPKFGFDPTDFGLSMVANSLTEKIKQTSMIIF